MAMRLRALLVSLLLATPALAVPPGNGNGDELPQAKELLAGAEAIPGLFTIHRKGHQAWLEVPAQLFEQPFLLATSISGGPQYAGYQWWDTVAAWSRLDRRLLLVEREVRYRVQDPRKPVAEVVKRTYTDRLLSACSIVALNGANPVIDLNSLLAGQAQVFFGRLAQGLDSSVVFWTTTKGFPQNVAAVLSMPDRARDGRMTALAYSFSALPPPQQDTYRPRLADDRVGYFLTAVKDFTDDAARGDRFIRFAHRWRLEKADPSLERSPVKEPIIFYVEKTVPFRFRQAVAEGILEWNKAFEEIGLLGAVVVRQQTDTAFADLDPEDVRYNFFRWIVSERGFAMGPSRVNPWTGQILDADIIFDEAMVRSYLRQYDVAIKRAPRQFFSPEVQRLLDRWPTRYRFGQVPEGAEDLEAPAEGAVCSLGPGVAHELQLGALAARLSGARPGQDYPDAFLAEVVKDVVMHEVGHTLGLRHNFKASTWRSLGEINGDSRPDTVCASVMDYNPLNVSPEGQPQGNWTNRTIGPYDRWAIRYGYELLQDEAGGLKATVAAVASPQYAYATDEDTTGPDPDATRWDLGSDPLEFAQRRMDLAEGLWGQVVDKVVADGESFDLGRRAFDMLLYDYQRAALIAARYVGGQHSYRDHKGDPGGRDPLVPVPAARQRRALELICQRVLAAGNFRIDPAVLRKLGKGYWSHWGSRDPNLPASYPYHERILDVQSWALFALLNPETLERLIDTEAKADPDADRVTVPEVIDRLSRTVFGPLLDEAGLPEGGDARAPRIDTVQRNLQRVYAGELIDMVLEGEGGPTPPIVRALARQELVRLDSALLRSATRSYDPYTAAHLQDLRLQVHRALEANYQLGGRGGGGGAGVMLRLGEDGRLEPIPAEEVPPSWRHRSAGPGLLPRGE